jgi:hypothetical protein
MKFGMEHVVHMYVTRVVLSIKLKLFVTSVRELLKNFRNFICLSFVFIGEIPTPSKFHLMKEFSSFFVI